MWHESGRSISSSLPTNGTRWNLRVVSDRSGRRPVDLARSARHPVDLARSALRLVDLARSAVHPVDLARSAVHPVDLAQWAAPLWHSDPVVLRLRVHLGPACSLPRCL